MKSPILTDAATMRAWAIETGRQVGSRGPISADMHNQYVVAAARRAAQRAALTFGRVAVEVTPTLVRAANDRRARRQQNLGQQVLDD